MELPSEGSDDAWIIKPIPGYVAKWKDIKIKGAMGEDELRKCFINVCHCEQIPPPLEDIDEDTLAAKLDAGDTSFRIPISIGELDCVKDRKEENSIKIDILVNSAFYKSRLDSQFFRHFLAMIFCDLIQVKYDVILDPTKSIILKNRVLVGELETFRVRKKPEKRIVEEQIGVVGGSGKSGGGNAVQNELYGIKKIDGVKMRLFDGNRFEILLSISKFNPKIENPAQNLSLKLNPTRLMLLADKSRSLYDFSLPFKITPSSAKSKYLPSKNALVISVNLVFQR